MGAEQGCYTKIWTPKLKMFPLTYTQTQTQPHTHTHISILFLIFVEIFSCVAGTIPSQNLSTLRKYLSIGNKG